MLGCGSVSGVIGSVLPYIMHQTASVAVVGSSNSFIVASSAVAIRGFTHKTEVAGHRRIKVTI